jgi:transcriptional regulator with XRE-family HTH domain
MNIGRVVRVMRKARGLSGVELGQRMGINKTHILDLETGRRRWSSRMILAAARALGVRPFVLLMSDRERRRASLIFFAR